MPPESAYTASKLPAVFSMYDGKNLLALQDSLIQIFTCIRLTFRSSAGLLRCFGRSYVVALLGIVKRKWKSRLWVRRSVSSRRAIGKIQVHILQKVLTTRYFFQWSSYNRVKNFQGQTRCFVCNHTLIRNTLNWKLCHWTWNGVIQMHLALRFIFRPYDVLMLNEMCPRWWWIVTLGGHRSFHIIPCTWLAFRLRRTQNPLADRGRRTSC